MKKTLITLLITTIFSSCSLDDNSTPNFELEFLPILEVTLPEEFELGETYTFKIRHLRPTDCHIFRSYDYSRDGNERTVAVLNTVFTEQECKELENDTIETMLDFRVERDDFYIFKFWQGKDEDGENKFLTEEIQVVKPQ